MTMISNFLIFFVFDIFYFLSSDILEVDVKYPKRLHNFHCDLPLLLEKERKVLNAISLYAICMIKKVMLFTSLKQALYHGIILKKVHKVIHLIEKHGSKNILR